MHNRYFIHAGVPFSAVENKYFLAFLFFLRPMYKPPSRYVLSNKVLGSEAARIQLAEIDSLKNQKSMTLLVDGWEDAAGRSIYGVVAAEVKKAPIILGLSELTGKRATADAVVNVCEENLAKMNINFDHIAAICTDNPTTMISARRKLINLNPALIVSL